MMMPETSIHGVGLWNVTNEELAETANFLEQMAKSGTLLPKLAEKYQLEDAKRAHIETIEKSGCIGKKYFQVE